MKRLTTTVLLVVSLAPLASTAGTFTYQQCFQIASRMHGVPVDLLLAVASIESAMNPDARSNKDAHGIMQIQWPGTARHLGVQRVAELYNPCLNIELGARYLRELLDASNGDVERALAAYNYGPGRIARSPTLPEGAIGYASKVLSKQKDLKASAEAVQVSLTDQPGVIFDSRHRAERFARTLNEKISGAEFTPTRTRGGKHQVEMKVGNAGLSPTDVALLETLGWSSLGASR